MRKFTQLMLTLALMIVGVGKVNALEPVYPALKTYDLSLDATKWTTGWSATAANDEGNLAITLTGNYGAKGISLTETAATPLSSCNKICVVIENYAGGWGQLLARSGGADKASKTYGTVTAGSPQTITLEYDPADNIDEFLIQCGTGTPTVTISRVYLLEKAERMPGTKIYTYDYDGKSSFPWYHDDGWGTKPAVSDVLTATNDAVKGDPSNYMFFVGDNITTDENKEYYVRATVKGSVAGSIVCNLGTWGKSVEKTLSLTGEYQDVDILLSGVPTANNNHVIFKIGKYVGTISLKKIEIYEALGAQKITVSSAGWATLYSDNALDFSSATGLTAYTASVAGSTVTLTAVADVPANTGVVLKGAEGTYKVPVIASSSTAKGDLTGSTTDGLTYDAGATNDYYFLALNGEGKAQFTKLTEGTIAAGKAYFSLAKGGSARELSVVFDDDEPTAIDDLTVDSEKQTEKTFFDLQGRKVVNPTKGIYIVDGKKVIINE